MTNDVVLMTYLATITKGLATTSEVRSYTGALSAELAADTASEECLLALLDIRLSEITALH